MNTYHLTTIGKGFADKADRPYRYRGWKRRKLEPLFGKWIADEVVAACRNLAAYQ